MFFLPLSLYSGVMLTIEKHAPGTFCWVELATTDQPVAKHFYHTLFGWHTKDILVSPNHVYTIFQLDERAVSGVYTLHHDELSKGIEPHWRSYIAVASADDAASRAQSLGAAMVSPPADVMDVGRMALLRDPTGAEFAVWQSRSHIGTEVAGADGVPCWATLFTPDLGRAREFYSALFGWKLVMSRSEGCLQVTNGEEYIGGILSTGAAGKAEPATAPHWLIYFSVSDCAEAAATALRNEAISASPVATLEDVGEIVRIKDPDGADFGVLQILPGTRVNIK